MRLIHALFELENVINWGFKKKTVMLARRWQIKSKCLQDRIYESWWFYFLYGSLQTFHVKSHAWNHVIPQVIIYVKSCDFMWKSTCEWILCEYSHMRLKNFTCDFMWIFACVKNHMWFHVNLHMWKSFTYDFTGIFTRERTRRFLYHVITWEKFQPVK